MSQSSLLVIPTSAALTAPGFTIVPGTRYYSDQIVGKFK